MKLEVIKEMTSRLSLYTRSTTDDRPDADIGRAMFNIEGSSCAINPHTKSRSNFAHLKVVAELLVRNHEVGGYKGSIATSYKDQRNLVSFEHRQFDGSC